MKQIYGPLLDWGDVGVLSAKDTMNPVIQSLWTGLPQSKSCTNMIIFRKACIWCHLSGDLSAVLAK